MKVSFLVPVLCLLASLNVNATIRETGGRMIPVTTEFNCFNRVQMTDGPAVAIVITTTGDVRSVEITNRAEITRDMLTLVYNNANGQFYKGQRTSAVISVDGKTANVKFLGSDLIYTCKKVGS